VTLFNRLGSASCGNRPEQPANFELRSIRHIARNDAERRYHGVLEETFMGMFDGLLGGIVGAGLVSIVSDVLEKHGGVQGVVSQFEKNGLGATVQSWVGTGPNQPVSPDDVQRVLGPDLLKQLSEKTGASIQDLTQKLAHVLPQAVDKLTPDGTIPKV
jgi:uncharacterized protein YidB (DUF937 family)